MLVSVTKKPYLLAKKENDRSGRMLLQIENQVADESGVVGWDGKVTVPPPSFLQAALCVTPSWNWASTTVLSLHVLTLWALA